MKNFLPITAILGLTLACAPPNKMISLEDTLDSSQNEKRVHIEKQIAPGTCSIHITNCELASENTNHWIIGNISSVLAYGAGFTSTFENGQVLKIKLTELQASNLKTEKEISCIISNMENLTNTSHYKLLNYTLQDYK